MYLFTSHHCIFYEEFVPVLSSTSICFHLNLLLKQIYSQTIPSLQLKTLTLKCWDFINSLMMRKRPAKPDWSKLISQEGKQLGSKRQWVPWQDWLKYHVGRQLFPWLLFARTDLICVCVCPPFHPEPCGVQTATSGLWGPPPRWRLQMVGVPVSSPLSSSDCVRDETPDTPGAPAAATAHTQTQTHT